MKGLSLYKRASRGFHDYPFLSKFVVVCAISGGGLVAYADANSSSAAAPLEAVSKRKKVVVLGTGWAGTSFLKKLDNPSYDVQVISPRNYFAFTPLLPSVTCGTVEARSIVEPIRNIVRKKNVDVCYWEAECFKIDAENKKVYCRSTQNNNLNGKEEFAVEYDYLVIAMGARPNTFNTPGVVEHCNFLKEVEDAQKIRRNVIDSFEKASLPNLSDEERKRILHFVVVGGGPTGVEFAAELHDFVNEDLVKLYPAAKDFVKITLLEAADHILGMFDKRITEFAEEKFRRDGIDVKLGSMVVKVSDKEISTKVRGNGETSSIPYGMVVWSTGIGTHPVIRDFMGQVGQTNRRALATDEWLRVEGCNDVYALGDCATVNQRKVMEDISAIFKKADKDNSGTLTAKEFQEVINDICERYPQVELYLKNKKMRNIVDLLKEDKGDVAKESIELNIEEFKTAVSEVDSQMKYLPATAQVASQQGTYLATCFNRMEEAEKNPEGPLRFRGEGRHRFRPFRYKHLGQFAPLGGEQTAAQLPGDWVSIGHSTQWLWYSVYASKQVSWRTRALVVTDWTRRFIFGRDSSRI
ncbi:external alternative NAD(P)H-ubiquinone oxidoreductase B2, mitochondrial [Ricinus communis]|uniref:NADH:ubiquinone reductase (non-electrogenic) n=1 Tax=Ricinus communis TaxID=3988 RepID=B9SFB6_RICCO|nr:external alternative NAD(P)H-ubiquinone oxidoreductase B2, mitochondrial [Ricinus communis]EEF37704.1 NADH dehydrogenase, putative [Ricinus communis]|eukprot:XP_002524685.1 external alternative NAD(P)H-ubiquinone oxidoreductase B2, mitochondrial [Ricinus communis]